MNNVEYVHKRNTTYVVVNDKVIGEIFLDDGIYYFWCDDTITGAYPILWSDLLRSVADKLDEMNKKQEEEFERFLKPNNLDITDYF